MQLSGREPRENLPMIDTDHDPALFFDGENLLLAYSVAQLSGGGMAVLEFSDVLEFHADSINVDELSEAPYPVTAWGFTEIIGSKKCERWAAMAPRYWSISFNDHTLLVMFEHMRIAGVTRNATLPRKALQGYMLNS